MEIYTAEQAAEIFGVSHSTVIRWVGVGLLHATQLTAADPVAHPHLQAGSPEAEVLLFDLA